MAKMLIFYWHEANKNTTKENLNGFIASLSPSPFSTDHKDASTKHKEKKRGRIIINGYLM